MPYQALSAVYIGIILSMLEAQQDLHETTF